MGGYNIPLTEEEAKEIFRLIDIQGEGYINHNEFLSVIIGTMNEERQKLVTDIYNLLDVEDEKKVPFKLLEMKFTPARAPDVIRRKRTPEDVRQEFEETLYLYYYELV